MQLIKYSSIENTYREVFIEQVKAEGKDGGDWVVTEKVHGGQLSFYYNGSEMRASSRTMFLEPDADFFNYQKVMADNIVKVNELYGLLKKERPELTDVIVYGELFGGSYAHPDVQKIKNAKRLQKGVEYHPDNLFYAFDIRANGNYLTVDHANRLFEETGLFYAKPLFRGTFEQCLKHADDFPSKISQWLGLPPIADNIAEGIVIKPVEPCFIKGERVILKAKNEKFKERKAVKKRPKKDKVKRSEKGKQLQREMETLVTENRLINVLSKRGELPTPVPKDIFGDIMKEFVHDVIEEFNKDFGNEFDQLDGKEQKMISKQLNQWASKLVRGKMFTGS